MSQEKKIKPAVVILGAGLLQTPLIQAVKKRGWKTIVADQNEKAPGAAFADVFLRQSTNDTSAIIDRLISLKIKISLCVTSGTDMTQSMAAINEAFHLPGLNKAQALVTTHKGKMRDFLLSCGIPQPEYTWGNKKDEIHAWMSKKQFRKGFVIKPLRNMGARGVMKLNHPDELGFAFEFASSYSHEPGVIVEEYIPGREYSVDALCRDEKLWITGLADRIIELKDERFFIETGHSMPTGAPAKTREQIQKVLEDFAIGLSKLGSKPYLGALKGDIRETETGEILVGEIAGRLSGGFMSTHTYPGSTGVDLMDAYLGLLSGDLPESLKNETTEDYKKTVIERALTAEPGLLTELTIPEKMEKEITGAFYHIQKNQWVRPLKNNIGKTANFIIEAGNLENAENTWQQLRQKIKITTTKKVLSQKEINKEAKKNFHSKFCRVCSECDGKNCASGVPGMGGAGNQKAFQRNSEDLKQITFYPEYISNNLSAKTPETAYTLFGKNLTLPVLGAPITGAFTNMGGSLTEYEFAMETGAGGKLSGVYNTYGDGASEDKYFTAIEAIKNYGGVFFAKPRKAREEIIKRGLEAKKAGAFAWGIDIDSVGLLTMRNRNVTMSRKSVEELAELKKAVDLPFLIKGILTVEDAERAAKSGADAIVVSNHGGRILDSSPSAISVLPKIASFLRKNFPQVTLLADGGIRHGSDIFKMIASGADCVLIGRPLAIAAVAYGRFGVYSVMENLRSELETILMNLGIENIQSINSEYLKKTD